MTYVLRKRVPASLFFFLFLLSPGWIHGQSLPEASPEEVGMSAERLQRLDRVMQSYVEEGKVPGMVVMVLRNGQVVRHTSYGDLDPETGSSMPLDAIFRIASQSKAVTSVGVMILQEEGKLLLSDPLSKYIPSFKNPQVAVPVEGGSGGYTLEPARREITIRDLLTHTSGYSYGSGPAEAAYQWDDVFGWYFADHEEPIGSAVERIAQLPLVSQPGERWVYGFSTDILGRLIEVVSGQSLAEFLQDRVFGPLKMRDTHFYLPEGKLSRFTPVYGINQEGELYLVEPADENDYVSGPRQAYSGGAGLLSTALDYARFLQALLNGGELEGARILSPKSVELMTSNHVGDLYAGGAQGFGLGFWITKAVGRTPALTSDGAYGWGGAYYTTYWVDPAEGLVGVLMTQLRPATGLDLHGKFNTMVYQAIAE